MYLRRQLRMETAVGIFKYQDIRIKLT